LSQIISSIPLAQSIVGLAKKAGIKHVVISPGSRNAPLTISFALDPFFKTYSIVDERCAAFFAMGMAQQLQEPTIIVCTSGSAMLNYFPAVTEAFYSQIPLVVISADRPEHLIDIGDGQTIRQTHVFNHHVGYQAHLKSDIRDGDNSIRLNFNNKEIYKSLQIAQHKSLPVHLNAPFDEPLYGKADNLSVDLDVFDFEDIDELPIKTSHRNQFVSAWNNSKRKLILVGVSHPNDINVEDLKFLNEDDSVIVMTETTSNLNSSRFFYSIDGILAPIELDENKDSLLKKLQPELLLTFGGMLVSKKLKAFLRDYRPLKHFHIHPYHANDTFFADVKHLPYKPEYFLRTIKADLLPQASEYYSSWKSIFDERIKNSKVYLEKIPYSDFWVYPFIFNALPNDIILHLGNSSCVRYSNLFDLDTTIEVFCNRGTSGIDGSTSTALGHAVVSSKQNFLLCGDLSFLYDSNGLWNSATPDNFKIIVINNRGGGIFRILPGDKNDRYFNTYFETQHEYDASHLAKMYGYQYFISNNKEELKSRIIEFMNSNQRSILEIFTPTDINDEVLLNYFRFINNPK
jgi:2-succinyl-5-enolpyruvyl-6-hydroxy-3-cyclohexene-1-carboxylate synthase